MMRAINHIAGFDGLLLNECDQWEKLGFSAVSVMVMGSCLITGFSVYQFFHLAFSNQLVLFCIAILSSCVLLNIYRLIIHIPTQCIANYNLNGFNKDIALSNSHVIKVVLLLCISMMVTCGMSLWIFDDLISSAITGLSDGTYKDETVRKYLLVFIDDTYDTINTLLTRLNVLPIILGKSKWILVLIYISVSTILLLPFMTRLLGAGIYNGTYNKLFYKVNHRTIISEFEYTEDLVNLIRYHQGLPAMKYRSFHDEPFNTNRRHPVLDETYDLSDYYTEEELKIK